MLSPKGVNGMVALRLTDVSLNAGVLLQPAVLGEEELEVGAHVIFKVSDITSISVDNTHFAIIPSESIVGVLTEL